MEIRIYLRRDNSIPSVAKKWQERLEIQLPPLYCRLRSAIKILNYRETMAQLHAGQGTTRQILSWLIAVS